MDTPFQQRGLDFIREFHENSSNGFKWILTAIDYFTRWVEAGSLLQSSSTSIVEFLEIHLVIRFGVPTKITIDNASVFKIAELIDLCA